MISGIGVDIVRIDRAVADLANRVLSCEEREIYLEFKADSRKQEFLAGRFAAKEALIKAFQSKDIVYGFRDWVIVNDPEGKPFLKSPVIEGYSVFLSISHEREYAVALCVVETTSNTGALPGK